MDRQLVAIFCSYESEPCAHDIVSYLESIISIDSDVSIFRYSSTEVLVDYITEYVINNNADASIFVFERNNFLNRGLKNDTSPLSLDFCSGFILGRLPANSTILVLHEDFLKRLTFRDGQFLLNIKIVECSSNNDGDHDAKFKILPIVQSLLGILTDSHKPLARPRRTFISYSHQDESLRRALNPYLSSLQRDGFISEWSDQQISPGQEWDKVIQKNLRNADIILLLVSQYFLASDYINKNEMARAIARHDRGEARVIPIILRPSVWDDAPFAKLEALPPKGKPVIEWKPRETAWLAVARGIRQAVQELRTARR